MEYVVNPSIRDAAELLELAKKWLFKFRTNPFWTLQVQRNQWLDISVFDDAVMNCALSKNAEETRVFVQEDGEGNILLTLPQIHHWERDDSVVQPRQWVLLAFNRFCSGDDIHWLQHFWHGRFSLREVADFLKRPVADVVQDVLKADANRLDTGQQILALSVDRSDADPAEWEVDIRGFMLGSLYTEDLPEISGVMVPRKSHQRN
jgi:hypothetical protein